MGGIWSALGGTPRDPTDTTALEAIRQKALQALKYALIVDHGDGPPHGKGVRFTGKASRISVESFCKFV